MKFIDVIKKIDVDNTKLNKKTILRIQTVGGKDSRLVLSSIGEDYISFEDKHGRPRNVAIHAIAEVQDVSGEAL